MRNLERCPEVAKSEPFTFVYSLFGKHIILVSLGLTFVAVAVQGILVGHQISLRFSGNNYIIFHNFLDLTLFTICIACTH